MNRVLSVIFFSVVLLMVGTVPPAVSSPRTTALGTVGDFCEDGGNALRWYGSLGDYQNTLTLDFGHFNIYKGYHDTQENTLSGPSVGIRHDLGGRRGQVAAWWRAREDDAPVPTLYRDGREAGFSLMYGRRVGPVQLALLFQDTPRQETTSAAGAPTHTISTENQVWGLGARFDLSPHAYVDLAADVRSNRETITFADPPFASLNADLASDQAWNLRARMFYQLGERTALVPVVEYLTEKRPVSRQDDDVTQSIDGHLLRLGCGLDFFPDTDRMLLVAAEWNSGSTDYLADPNFASSDWTNDWNSYAVQMGWETRYLPFMTLRGAVGYRLARGDGESPRMERSHPTGYDYDDLWYTLGAGFHLGGWDLDTALSEGEPRPVGGDWEWTRSRYDTTWLSVSLRFAY